MNAAALVEVSHLRVENANAVSGPLSWGFPPPTAFTGFTHALDRRLKGITLGGVGIVCHRFDPQTYPRIREPEEKYRAPDNIAQRFRLARHPGTPKDSSKELFAAIIEEGRAHLEVTLLIEVMTELDEDGRRDLAGRICSVLPTMRLAGGSIWNWKRIQAMSWPEWEEEQRKAFRSLRYRLLPGFALVQRDNLLAEHLADMRRDNPQTSPLEAFLDLLALHVDPVPGDGDDCQWGQARSKSGWLVPLSVGFAAISPLYEPGEVQGTRDAVTPFCFVEGVTTIGQWISPHRLAKLEDMLWHPETDTDKGLYLCRNAYTQLHEEESYGDDE